MIAESFLIRPRGHLLRNLVLFARLLRTLGVPAAPDQLVGLIAALPLLDLRVRDEFRDAARAALVTRREHVPIFDEAFDLFWRAWSTAEASLPEGSTVERPPPREEPPSPDADAETPPADADGGAASEDETAGIPEYSAAERLRDRDFAQLSEEELHKVRALMRELDWDAGMRRTRRRRAAAHGRHPDMRRALRQGLRYGGETVELAWQECRVKPRPLVVLCDVSGSMALYSRILLQFLFVLTNGLEHVEAFAFGTRLTRLTRQLRRNAGNRDIDAALGAASQAVSDWGGGTRIGESLKSFNYEWGRRVLGHGATVLIVSDGWDRGDLDLLRGEMLRLRLNTRRLIWLNPLLGAPGYRPLALGMATALPFVDEFLPVHNLASLARLAEVLRLTHSRRSEIR